jgi:mRNA-degrading endonuclease YafQ of YafQ-DinJ toxin-antitoxin module
MRTVEQSGQFKRDLKRESQGLHRQVLQSDFVSLIAALANDQPLKANGVRSCFATFSVLVFYVCVGQSLISPEGLQN